MQEVGSSTHMHTSPCQCEAQCGQDVYICGVMCNNAKGGSGASHCMYLRSEGQVLESCSSWLVPRCSHAAKPQHLPCGILRQALDSASLPKNEVTDFRTGEGRNDSRTTQRSRGAGTFDPAARSSRWKRLRLAALRRPKLERCAAMPGAGQG